MLDSFGRRITYLRISVTDRCNFRCRYCMPESGVDPIAHDRILRYEEILKVARISLDLGVNAIRITGGEPLVRKGLDKFIGSLSQYRDLGLKDLSLTTNGSLLPRFAFGLKRAGLDRVNISLDTLDPDRFRHITRRGDLSEVLRGIGAAIAAGLSPVKINVVITASTNADEIRDFALFAARLPIEVRFIELMPLGTAFSSSDSEFVPVETIKRTLSQFGELCVAENVSTGSGPAKYYDWIADENCAASERAKSAIELVSAAAAEMCAKACGSVSESTRARLGFITAISDCFCPTCSRLRLTADGKMSPCLWSTEEFDVRTPLRAGADDDELRRIIAEVTRAKPRDYFGAAGNTSARKMFRLGG